MLKLNRCHIITALLMSGCLGTMALPVHGETLQDALRAGLVNSETLAAARQGWVASREAIGSQSRTSDLSASFGVTGNSTETDNMDGAGYDQSSYTAASISLSKNIYDGGQTKQKTKLAELELDGAGASYIKTEQTVILDTVEAYLNVIKATREAKLLAANLKRLDAHVNAAQIRVDAGATTPTRLAEARARFARAKSDEILAQTRLSNANDAYQSLTGAMAGAFETPAIIQGLPIDILDAETIARDSHPDMLAGLAQERAAEQNFNTLKASVSPTLALSLTATSKTGSTSTLERDDVAANLVFSTPILSTNATRATARGVAARYEQAKLQRRNALRTVELGARQAFRNWQTSGTRLEAVLSEIEALNLVAKGIASEAQFGQKTTLDLLDAEQDVSDAELRLVTAEHNQLIAAFRLQAAVGRLTAAAMGLDDVMADLENMPVPADPFSSSFPFGRIKTGN